MQTEICLEAGQSRSKVWSPAARIQRLLDAHNKSTPSLGAERAIHYTEFYKRFGRHYASAAIRKALALADHLKRRTINIYPGEFIVGSHTEHRIGAICQIEYAGLVALEDLFRFEKRPVNPLHIDPSARRQLALTVMPYWLTRNLAATAFPAMQSIGYAYEQLNAKQFVINEAAGIAHFAPNYAELVQLGTDGIRAKIEKARTEPSLSEQQRDQLLANLIALQAVEDFAGRYRELALAEGNQPIAELLSRVPRQPPRTMQEALQLIWLFQLVIQIESLDQGISLGRIDQYLYPIFQREKQKDDFDADVIRDLFCAFCIKLSEIIPLFSERATQYFSGLPSGQAATLGGTDQEGRDASNELSFLLLDVIDKFKTRQPNWHARLSPQTGSGFSRRVFEAIAKGGGSPALYNDDVITKALHKRFPGAENVWDYATVGCVEPAIAGESFTSTDAAIFNLATILENVLLPKDAAGRQKLREIQSMDRLLDALAAELRRQLDRLQDCLDRIETANREFHPVPFSSLLVAGAIESATDLTAGGARYNASGIQGVGIADLADSLAAIDKLVFEDKKLSLEDLALACRNNFEKQSELRARLQAVEKFGNDQNRADYFAGRVARMFEQEIGRRRNTRGGSWVPGLYSMTCHRAMGMKTSALPSGRACGEALADGISPCDGNDRLGPTALLNSALNLDHALFGNGVNLNIKFDAGTLKGEAGATLLEGLIKGYFDKGGMQVQINVLDPELLLDARNNQQKHRNLLVRVSGYSAYFVDLTPAMQDEIIARTRLQA